MYVPIEGECNTSADCDQGELCVGHTCQTACSVSTNCPFGSYCVAGVCSVSPPPGMCTRGTCPSGWTCDPTTTRCLPMSPGIASCSSGTCPGTCLGDECTYPFSPGISCTTGSATQGSDLCPFTGDAYSSTCFAPGMCTLGTLVSPPTTAAPLSILLPGVGPYFLTSGGGTLGLSTNVTTATNWTWTASPTGAVVLSCPDGVLTRQLDGSVTITTNPDPTTSQWLATTAPSSIGGVVFSDPGLSWVLAATSNGVIPTPGLSPIPPFQSPAVTWYTG